MTGVGLRGRLVGAVLAVLAVLLAATALLVVVRADRALSEVEEARFRALTLQLADNAAYGTLAKSEALLAGPLDAFARAPDLVHVRVVDDEGALLAERAGPAPDHDVVTLSVPVRTRGSAPGDDGELAAFGVGAAEEREVGEVVATFSRRATREVERRMRVDIALAFTVLGGVGLLVVLALASRVVRRIRALADASSRVAAGRLDVAVDARGGDELAQLARDFSSMTDALAAQRKALDDAARALAERESLAAIGRATAVIAHEIKNPLGILLGAAQILQSPRRAPEQKDEAARMIEDEVKRLDHSLKDLLEYARPRSPERRPTSARALIDQTVERALFPGGPAEGLSVEVRGDDVRVLVDEPQAAQVLVNLLANARQAGAAGVVVSLERRDGGARVLVEDDGPGVDPSVAEQLFQPFVTTKARGAGLGLAASRRMARDNGGELSSLPRERGAAFALDLEEAP